MASLNSNPVHKLYMSVIEDVINNVRELDEGPEEHVLKELKTLWENKLIQSKAVEGFHTEPPGWETKQPRAMEGLNTERLPSWDNKHLMQSKGGFFNTEMQAALHASAFRHQQMHRFQPIAQPATAAQSQQQGLLPPPQQQAPQLEWRRYMPPHPQLMNNQGQFVQMMHGPKMMRGPKGDFYVQHQQQPFLLHQQHPMLLQKPMQAGGMQAHVVQQQLLSPLQGGLPQQPGVMVQQPPYVFVPRKQVMMTTMTPQTGSTAAWAHGAATAPQASGQTAAAWAHGAAAAPQASGQTAAAWAHGAAAATQASGQTAAAPQASGQTAAAWAHGAAAAPQASGQTAAAWAHGAAAAPQASGQTAAAWAHGAAAAPQASGQTAAAWAHGAAAAPQASGQTAAAWAHGAAAAPQAPGQTAAASQVSGQTATASQVSGQTAAVWSQSAAAAPQASGTTPWFQVRQAHVAAASQASGLSTAEWAKGAASPQAPRQPQAQQPPVLLQVDGTGDTSSSGEDDEEEEDVKYEVEKENEDGQIEEEPLNSGDDESGDEDKEDEFDAEYVVVCQYEKKVQRIKNRWKFQLKDGIMNLNGRDYIFSKAIGEAEW